MYVIQKISYFCLFLKIVLIIFVLVFRDLWISEEKKLMETVLQLGQVKKFYKVFFSYVTQISQCYHNSSLQYYY